MAVGEAGNFDEGLQVTRMVEEFEVAGKAAALRHLGQGGGGIEPLWHCLLPIPPLDQPGWGRVGMPFDQPLTTN